MPQFRKKPVVIEAMQFTADTKQQVLDWITCPVYDAWDKTGEPALYIETLEGNMMAQPGDWIICGVKGEFYPCKPDIFEDTYEPVNSNGGLSMTNDPTPEAACFNAMLDLWHLLKESKPTERNEVARRYAVTMTELEKVIGYFQTFVLTGYLANEKQ